MPPVVFFGAINSLSQTVLKLTSPGAPDIYQGTDLWDFSLVDPDNRRPVDYDTRQEFLKELCPAESGDLRVLCEDLLRNYSDGRIKMWTIMRILGFRRDHAELFRNSIYTPLNTTDKQEHVLAFSRRLQQPAERDRSMLITAVPRLAYTLMRGQMAAPLDGIWADAELVLPEDSPEICENIITGEKVQRSGRGTLLCREIFRSFPVAVLSAT